MSTWLDKRQRKWRYHFVVAGKRHHGFCVDPETQVPARTRSDAKRCELIAKGRAVAMRGQRAVPIGVYTFAEAVAAYVEVASRHRSWPSIKRYVAELLGFFGSTTPVDEITTDRINAYVTSSLKQPRMIWLGGPTAEQSQRCASRVLYRPSDDKRSAQTIRHYLKTLRTILLRAHRNVDPATQRPLLAVMPRLEMPRVPKRMPRPLGQEEILRVMAELAPHVADALQLSLHFGLRKKEALTLEVGNVDFGMKGIWLRGERTKNGADEFIPGNEAAMALLRRLVDSAREARQVRLVLFRGTRGDEAPRPIINITRGWSAARRRAGLSPTARFHDARAAYVTALAQSAPAPVVQALARHRDFETTLRYIRLTDDAKRDAVSSLPNWADPASSRTHESHTSGIDSDALSPNSLKDWRARRDSNSRPSAPELWRRRTSRRND